MRTICTFILLLVLPAVVCGQEGTIQYGTDKQEKFSFCKPTIPWLEDFNTYVWYEPIDNVSESIDQVNSGWVQGRVYLQSSASFVGIVDNDTVTYVESFEGTTPIDGGHAFFARWGILVTVNQWQGLIVQSPYGSWIQNVPYHDSEIAVVRIANADGRLVYSINGQELFTQAAPGIEARDLRAYYFGDVDNALIQVKCSR